MSQPINIFIAYAREDKSYLEELRRQMKILERRADTRIWYDGEIIAGQKWNEVIEAELEKADLFLMLLSADFINSEYAYTKEMTQALARHERGEAILIPIVVRACAWHLTPLADLQAPAEGKPLASATGGKRDELYTEIVNAIVKTIEERKKQKGEEARYFADEAAWKEALKLNSLFGFNRYLEQYPQGRHAADARKAIADVERKKDKEKENIERNAWQQAQQQSTIAAYQAYLQAYPNGQFLANAKQAIQFIQQDKVRQAQNADRTAFEKAKVESTIPAYRIYLINFPNGNYIKEANKAIKRLEQLPTPSRRNRLFPILLVLGLVGLGIWGIPKLISSSNENTLISSSFPEQPVDSTLKETYTRLPFEPAMVAVPGGTFTMGCKDGRDSECSDDEKPAHQVTLSDFYIGKYEVTVKEFAAFIEDTDYQTDADKNGGSYLWTGSEWKLKDGVNWKCDASGNIRPTSEYNHPVIHVSWNDAAAYCKWLSEKTGKTYRLPTEAEWEYAARGGQSTRNYLYAGSNNADEVAWYSANSDSKTHVVGTKKANELGIFDMSGNVWEWVQDCWHDSYQNAPSTGNPWLETNNGDCARRVLRGGSWDYITWFLRAAVRDWYFTNYRVSYIGFRVAQG